MTYRTLGMFTPIPIATVAKMTLTVQSDETQLSQKFHLSSSVFVESGTEQKSLLLGSGLFPIWEVLMFAHVIIKKVVGISTPLQWQIDYS